MRWISLNIVTLVRTALLITGVAVSFSIALTDISILHRLKTSYGCSNLEGNDLNDCSNLCKSNTTGTRKSKLSTEVIDSQHGVLLVKYKINSNLRFGRITMNLEVDENVSSAICLNETSSLKLRYHSSRSVQMKWCDNSSVCNHQCSDTVTVEFDYVFTGCYKVIVSIFKKIDSKQKLTRSCSCTQPLTTDYKKESFVDKKPIVAPLYSPDNYQNGSAIVPIFMTGKPLKVIVDVLYNDLEENKTQCTFNRLVHKNGHFKCDPAGNCSKMQVSSEYGDEKINCELSDLKPGNYVGKIYYFDDRCHSNSTWTNRTEIYTDTDSDGKFICKSIFGINAVNPTVNPVVIEPAPQSHTFLLQLVVISILVLVVIISIGSFIVKLHAYKNAPIVRKDRSTWPNRISHNIQLFRLGRPKVLLLYPRDCDAMMNIMDNFRDILKRANCEVFDCWDSEQYNDIATTPNIWMQYKILRSDHIIVVASDCSRLLERNLIGNERVSYNQPQCFDDLFLFGLQFLHRPASSDFFKKIFIISLRGCQINGNARGLSYMDLATEFVLPVHLENLLLSLHRLDMSSYSFAMEIKEIRKFTTSIEVFNHYIQHYPNYLDDIIRMNLVESSVQLESAHIDV